ncbi:MAG TPA: hypothetical protein VJ436_10050 [Anaerolineales bacterium]|nr:hypothetical protein [Anaerolineales bacterium]
MLSATNCVGWERAALVVDELRWLTMNVMLAIDQRRAALVGDDLQ